MRARGYFVKQRTFECQGERVAVCTLEAGQKVGASVALEDRGHTKYMFHVNRGTISARTKTCSNTLDG